MTSARRGLLLAAAAGALAGACWLPLAGAPLLPLAFLLQARALRHASRGRDAVMLGVLCGVFRYAVAAHFLLALLRYSNLAFVFYLLTIVFILPMAIAESWVAFTLYRRSGLPPGFGFAAMWVLGEKLRTMGDMSFPADLLGHAFGFNPSFLGWSGWIGPFGVTLGLGLTGAMLDLAVEAWRGNRRRAVAWSTAAVVLWAAPALTSVVVSRPVESSAAMRVGLVQPSVDIDEKLAAAHAPAGPAAKSMWATLRQLTMDAKADGAELVVWPETARPGAAVLRNGTLQDEDVAALAKEAGVSILYGTIIAEVEGTEIVGLYNGAALATPDGRVPQWYGKQRLLPFVEAVPFGRLLGWDPRARAREGERRSYLGLLGNFTAGPTPTIFQVGPARIGVLICYEGMYPQLGRAYRLAGANALAVLTNDYWWGRSVFAAWHARMVSSRARELGLPVIRAANSGVSSVTAADGRMGDRTGLFESRFLSIAVRPSTTPPTFYARHGDLVIVAILLALSAAVIHGALYRPGLAGRSLEIAQDGADGTGVAAGEPERERDQFVTAGRHAGKDESFEGDES